MCLYHRFVTSIFKRCLTSEIVTTKTVKPYTQKNASDFATWIWPKIAVIQLYVGKSPLLWHV